MTNSAQWGRVGEKVWTVESKKETQKEGVKIWEETEKGCVEIKEETEKEGVEIKDDTENRERTRKTLTKECVKNKDDTEKEGLEDKEETEQGAWKIGKRPRRRVQISKKRRRAWRTRKMRRRAWKTRKRLKASLTPSQSLPCFQRLPSLAGRVVLMFGFTKLSSVAILLIVFTD